MTDKRFTLTTTEFDGTLSFYDAIYDCETRMSTEYVLNAVETTLNQLAEENEQLKQGLEELKEIGDYQADRIKELQEFEDKVFDSLNDKIKRGEKAIEWGKTKGAGIGAMGFHIELLKQFKKELEE